MTDNIDRLLKAAGPAPGPRPQYDLEAGRRYITERLAARQPPTTPPSCPCTPRTASLPTPASIHDDATRDLRALETLVINEPESGELLAGLVDEWVEPRGGLVFACLLDLTGLYREAQWWWQFAAGAGDLTAAYCLYLHHMRLGELREAEHWFRQAARLDGPALTPAHAVPDLPGYLHAVPAIAPPLPDTDSLPRPDHALREAIDGLPAHRDDICGSFSLPTEAIADQLQELVCP
ncbi:hypothetical protein ACFXPX_13530 [Kitasatospora sp. NPDC059146]|uniref:hypothetical protein n=1 Tax=Kitasatospora sp. NPDC059146 TaxID=3346741 RepID=UPI003690AB35